MPFKRLNLISERKNTMNVFKILPVSNGVTVPSVDLYRHVAISVLVGAYSTVSRGATGALAAPAPSQSIRREVTTTKRCVCDNAAEDQGCFGVFAELHHGPGDGDEHVNVSNPIEPSSHAPVETQCQQYC
jgi:hypothetical protein